MRKKMVVFYITIYQYLGQLHFTQTKPCKYHPCPGYFPHIMRWLTSCQKAPWERQIFTRWILRGAGQGSWRRFMSALSVLCRGVILIKYVPNLLCVYKLLRFVFFLFLLKTHSSLKSVARGFQVINERCGHVQLWVRQTLETIFLV